MTDTFASLLRTVTGTIAPVAQDNARHEAELIVTHVCQTSRSQMYLHGTRTVDSIQAKTIREHAHNRATGTPLGYVLGSVHFHSVDIAVDPRVLLPRPDTEVLVETVLNNESDHDELLFLDLGTGSGAISAAITANRPRWTCISSDISDKALACAGTNMTSRMRLLRADGFDAFAAKQQFYFIVSNPPYISSTGLKELDSSVRDHEPLLALNGGPDGLMWYREFAANAPLLLRCGGHLYCEIGYDQGETAQNIFLRAGWTDIRVIPDLAGRNRIIVARTPKL